MRPRKNELAAVVALLDAEHPDVETLAGEVCAGERVAETMRFGLAITEVSP